MVVAEKAAEKVVEKVAEEVVAEEEVAQVVVEEAVEAVVPEAVEVESALVTKSLFNLTIDSKVSTSYVERTTLS